MSCEGPLDEWLRGQISDVALASKVFQVDNLITAEEH